MDGLLLVDKPSGPTSHDIVARLRSVTGERSIGHTGTLDPLASGLLPLVLGRATRLAQFLTGGDKTYDAVIRLGSFTDTDDALGRALPDAGGTRPDDAGLDAALAGFRGTLLQTPPRHSAKKIGGRKAYDLARQDVEIELQPVSVTVRSLELVSREGPDGGDVRVRVTATSGFYVRALARDIGKVLGCGAHLAALRRTQAGAFGVEQALPFADVERLGHDVAAHLLSPADALADLAAVTVTEPGLRRALHGNSLNPEHLSGQWVPPGGPAPVRILDAAGSLVALAYARGGALHPTVVLS